VDALAVELDERLHDAIEAGRAQGLHGVVVLHHGEVVLERYGAGEDFSWGDSLGHVTFGPDTLHDVRSVSKSVTALVYGIALEAGLVPEPQESLLRNFPQYPDLMADPERAGLTVEHALTMTLGLEWNEDVPYTSTANSEIAMEMAPDRFRFVLERPIAEPPGERWHYCGGATALLGWLIERGAGERLPDVARRVLFAPLGIDAFDWMSGDDGVAAAASGLRLTPRSLVRIGELVLAGGVWNGGQVVPARWLDRALRPFVAIEEDFEYGYQWYLGTTDPKVGPGGARTRWVGGIGNGGQHLFVATDLDLVVVVTAGNYDTEDQWVTPTTVIDDVVLPSIRP